MKKFTGLLFTLGFVFCSAQDLMLIKFADKPSAQTYFSNPELMLSQKAIDRREKYNIEIDMLDVPVEQAYVDQVTALGITPLTVSKWFNGIFAWLTEEQADQAAGLSFVTEVESFVRDAGRMSSGSTPADKFSAVADPESSKPGHFNFDYGYTETQVKQINLDYLHELGFTGDGITVAVLDNGFPGVDTEDGFSYIRDNGQIKGGYNFVNDNENIYGNGSHGTVVLSTIGGYIENEFVGTAIDADFYLFITEDNTHELPDEEVHWIAAAERADSIGVDVINTSLGYYEFDDSRYNYDYQAMDGETTYISRGAQFAAEKGIMVVVSAGNEGNNSWHYITAPADAKDVFTIGAVDSNGSPAGFSSYGPTADGRIKPDVDALGSWASVIRPDGSIDYSSGTSFSSPITAGAMACLIQSSPNVHPQQLRQYVRETGDHYSNPTDQMGYGIPDFGAAYNKCLGVSDFELSQVKVFPNPTSRYVRIDSEVPVIGLQLISFEGKIVRRFESETVLDIGSLPDGVYILKVKLANGKTETKKIIKKQ